MISLSWKRWKIIYVFIVFLFSSVNKFAFKFVASVSFLKLRWFCSWSSIVAFLLIGPIHTVWYDRVFPPTIVLTRMVRIFALQSNSLLWIFIFNSSKLFVTISRVVSDTLLVVIGMETVSSIPPWISFLYFHSFLDFCKLGIEGKTCTW